jgi:hypothetical protein
VIPLAAGLVPAPGGARGQDNPFALPKITAGEPIKPGAISISPDKATAEAPAELEKRFAALVEKRRDAMARVEEARGRADKPAEWNAGLQLANVESHLIAMAESLPQVDPRELAALRDQHVGVLKFLADGCEKSDLAACQRVWVDMVAQLVKLNGT